MVCEFDPKFHVSVVYKSIRVIFVNNVYKWYQMVCEFDPKFHVSVVYESYHVSS